MTFLRIATGYLAAAYCASLTIGLLIGSEEPWTASRIAALPMTATFGMMFSVPLTLVQLMFLIILAETFQYRKPAYYILTGALTGVSAILLLGWRAGPILALFVIWAPAGALSGCVYWLIAGRRAVDVPRTGMAGLAAVSLKAVRLRWP